MKSFHRFFTKWATTATALLITLTGCVVAPPQNVTIVEGVTLNEPIHLPICGGLEIEIKEDKRVDINGLENVTHLCVYHDSTKKWQVKGLTMALVAYPVDKKPTFVTENFMLALLGKENLLMRIQIDTNGMRVQDETLAELSKLLGKPSVIQKAPKENFWGATEGATLAAWNTDFIEAMYIGEIEATRLGSISLTSKKIYEHTQQEETQKNNPIVSTESAEQKPSEKKEAQKQETPLPEK